MAAGWAAVIASSGSRRDWPDSRLGPVAVNASIRPAGWRRADSTAAAIIFWPSGLVPQQSGPDAVEADRGLALRRRGSALVGSDRGRDPSYAGGVADQEPGQLLLRDPPGDVAVSREGSESRASRARIGSAAATGAAPGRIQAAALGLPAKGVLHELAHGPLVAWRRPLPLAVGDLAGTASLAAVDATYRTAPLIVPPP